MTNPTNIRFQGVARRVKTPRSYYILFVITILLLLFYGWGREQFDIVLGFGYSICLALFMIMFVVLGRLALKSPLGKLHGRLASVAVIGGVIIVSVLISITWQFLILPGIVRGVLRSDGEVVMAKVVNYDLYNSDSRAFGGYKINDISRAGFIRVYLRLPDGRTTSLAVDRSGWTYRGDLSKEDGAVIITELLQSQMKVRYWKHGVWLARPEVEFSPLTKDEGCMLLHDASPVCQ